jgi:hypothetical protein
VLNPPFSFHLILHHRRIHATIVSMTNDEHPLPPKDLPEAGALPLPDEDLRYAPPAARSEVDPDLGLDSSVDVLAALAAVSSLSDLVAEREAVEQAAFARVEADAQAEAERQARLNDPTAYLPVPPMLVPARGQLATLVPGLLLIALGAWLTFSLTTTRTLPDTPLLLAVLFGIVALSLLARWLTSGRWSRGSLFLGLALLLLPGIGFVLMQPASPGWVQGWPLLMVAPGLALILTGLLAKPRTPGLIVPGLALIAAAAAGLAVTLDLLPTDLLNMVSPYWFVPLIVVVLLALLPLVFNRRA